MWDRMFSSALTMVRSMEANCFLGLLKVLRKVHVAESRPDNWDSFCERKESTFRRLFVCCLLNYMTVNLDLQSLKRCEASYSFPFAKSCLPIQSEQIKRSPRQVKKYKLIFMVVVLLLRWGRLLTIFMSKVRSHHSEAQGNKWWLLFIISQIREKGPQSFTLAVPFWLLLLWLISSSDKV